MLRPVLYTLDTLLVVISLFSLFIFLTTSPVCKYVPPNFTDVQSNFTDAQSQTVYQEQGHKYGIDPALLQAIAKVESNEVQTAINLSDPSFGLMQIYCVPNRQGVCTNKFPAVNDWEGTTIKDLLDTEVNVSIGAQILKWNLDKYGFPKGVAVYNSWSARKDPPDGPYRNQEYVNKVVKAYERLKRNSA